MDVKTKVEDFLLDLGVPPQIKGFALLADAVTMCAEDTDLALGITKLYRTLAEKNGDTPSRIERAMRHAIGRALERSQICNELFRGRKPCNSEFLATVALHVRREEAIK